MGHVRVIGAKVTDDTIESLQVELSGLGKRTIDRDTTIAWLRDGHSFLPVRNGEEGPALQLVTIEEGDEASFFVRQDNAAEAKDDLGAF